MLGISWLPAELLVSDEGFCPIIIIILIIVVVVVFVVIVVVIIVIVVLDTNICTSA
jgi:hypothetical protein